MAVESPENISFTNELVRTVFAEQAVMDYSKSLPSGKDADKAIVKCKPTGL